ncbi:MAG: HI1506-related protein [Desulfobacterales bacterium]|nr:HI1506-related protein [Desulfobacterales bacterium]
MTVLIQSSKEGFRRCGVAHSKSPTKYEDGDFTEDQLIILMDEPKLSVKIIPDKSVRDDSLPEEPEKGELDPSVLSAARKAIEAGDIISSGAPDIKAMEAILGSDVTKEQRDQAFDTIRAEAKE